MNYTIIIHPYYEEIDKDPMKVITSKWLESENYNRFTKTMQATIAISLRNKTFDQYLIYPTLDETPNEI